MNNSQQHDYKRSGSNLSGRASRPEGSNGATRAVPPIPEPVLREKDWQGEVSVPDVNTLRVELPISDEPYTEYFRRTSYPNVNVSRMSKLQQDGVRRLFNGLLNARATLRDGKPISCWSDAFKWVAEKLANVVPPAE